MVNFVALGHIIDNYKQVLTIQNHPKLGLRCYDQLNLCYGLISLSLFGHFLVTF